MKIVPIADTDLRRHLAGRIRSGQYWIFIAAGGPPDCLLEIERQFYDRGAAADDFELSIVPWRLGVRIGVIASAHKRRLPRRKLIRTLSRFVQSDKLEAMRAELRDILVLNSSDDDGRALLFAFWDFLEPGAAMRAAMMN